MKGIVTNIAAVLFGAGVISGGLCYSLLRLRFLKRQKSESLLDYFPRSLKDVNETLASSEKGRLFIVISLVIALLAFLNLIFI